MFITRKETFLTRHLKQLEECHVKSVLPCTYLGGIVPYSEEGVWAIETRTSSSLVQNQS
jgi:hypothetical protein